MLPHAKTGIKRVPSDCLRHTRKNWSCVCVCVCVVSGRSPRRWSHARPNGTNTNVDLFCPSFHEAVKEGFSQSQSQQTSSTTSKYYRQTPSTTSKYYKQTRLYTSYYFKTSTVIHVFLFTRPSMNSRDHSCKSTTRQCLHMCNRSWMCNGSFLCHDV